MRSTGGVGRTCPKLGRGGVAQESSWTRPHTARIRVQIGSRIHAHPSGLPGPRGLPRVAPPCCRQGANREVSTRLSGPGFHASALWGPSARDQRSLASFEERSRRPLQSRCMHKTPIVVQARTWRKLFAAAFTLRLRMRAKMGLSCAASRRVARECSAGPPVVGLTADGISRRISGQLGDRWHARC